VEPLDEALHHDVLQLQGKTEQLMLKLASARRESPQVLATLLSKIVEAKSSQAEHVIYQYPDFPVEGFIPIFVMLVSNLTNFTLGANRFVRNKNGDGVFHRPLQPHLDYAFRITRGDDSLLS
jgi:hypothetical protein